MERRKIGRKGRVVKKIEKVGGEGKEACRAEREKKTEDGMRLKMRRMKDKGYRNNGQDKVSV